MQLGVAVGCWLDLWPGPAASPPSFMGGWKAIVFRSVLCRHISSSRVWRIALWSLGTSLVWPAVGQASQLELALSAVMQENGINEEEKFRPAI